MVIIDSIADVTKIRDGSSKTVLLLKNIAGRVHELPIALTAQELESLVVFLLSSSTEVDLERPRERMGRVLQREYIEEEEPEPEPELSSPYATSLIYDEEDEDGSYIGGNGVEPL